MEKTTQICLCLLLIGYGLYGQETKKNVYGRVADVQTNESIPFVHVVCSGYGTVTNLNGLFLIPAQQGDTLYFSHINYGQYIIIIDSVSRDSLRVFLFPTDILLNEVTVRQLPSEEQFKKQILETHIRPNRQKTNADQNIANTKKLFLSGYVPELNSEDNYKQYIQGPQGVSIFSSNPSKGLFKALKDLPYDHTSPKVQMSSGITPFYIRLRPDTLSGE